MSELPAGVRYATEPGDWVMGFVNGQPVTREGVEAPTGGTVIISEAPGYAQKTDTGYQVKPEHYQISGAIVEPAPFEPRRYAFITAFFPNCYFIRVFRSKGHQYLPNNLYQLYLKFARKTLKLLHR